MRRRRRRWQAWLGRDGLWWGRQGGVGGGSGGGRKEQARGSGLEETRQAGARLGTSRGEDRASVGAVELVGPLNGPFLLSPPF